LPPLEVRDYVAERMASMFNLEVQSNPDRGPISRLLLRAVVTELARKELAATPGKDK
jgi:hypothetical protein